MSKIILTAFAFCLFLPQAVFPQKKSDLERLEIRGKAKKIEYFDSQFDAQGNRTKKICYGRAFFGDALRSFWAEERIISYY